MTDLRCPKCGGSMRYVSTADGSAWRCEGCAGLWIDAAGHDYLKAVAKTIDTGDATAGADADAHDRITCPVCNCTLLRMVDPHQAHIRFESCPICYGRYYDAGEFTDLSRNTLADVFRHLFASERS